MTLRIAVSIILLAFLSGCETYRLDPFDPRLPEYSSDGSDVAGCIFNGGVWTDFCSTSFYDNDCVSLLINYDSVRNASRLGFSGTLTHNAQGSYVGQAISISFVIQDRRIASLEDLKSLQERVSLSGEFAYPEITYYGEGDSIISECPSGFTSKGNLYLHDVFLRDATEYSPPTIVMAGTFGFSLESECRSFKVERGRFDYDHIYFRDETW